MEDSVDKGKAKCDEVPVPAEILTGILQQLKLMNSKLETNPTAPSKPVQKEGQRYGRVQMLQDTSSDQKHLFRKGDLPYFNGTNAQMWLNCVERFFKINKLVEDEKLQLVSLHMEGPAQGWFIYTEENFGFENWLGFRHYFEKRYKFSARSLCTQLMNLRQRGTVSEYRSEFEDLVAFLSHVPNDIQETAYLNGLKPEVRIELNKYRPFGIQDIMDYSLEAESNLATLDEQGRQDRAITHLPRANYNNNNPRPMVTNRGEGRHQQQPREAPIPTRNEVFLRENKKKITRLSPEEFLHRKEKGLCFNCNDKYTPGHRCNKKLSIYMLQEDIEVEEDQPITEEDLMQLDEVPLFGGEIMAIQGNKVDTGLKPASFRLWGKLYDYKVRVLIDGGATYNFLRPSVIQQLNIQVRPYHKFSIALGNGFCQQTEGICWNLPIKFQGLCFKQNFIPFPLGICDMILGIPWLKTLGWFHCNYHHLMLKFYWDGRVHTIISDPELNSLSCFASPALLVKKKDGGFRLCIDYRALNQITVPKRFPIPMVDELLEELYGMKVFSIIDLKSGHVSGPYELDLPPASPEIHIGVSTDPSKIEAITKWKIPATLKELRGFLGLTGYYRRFASNYAAIAQPLTALLKKNSFAWTEKADLSFIDLKQALSKAHVLRLPNFSLPFSIETDASDIAVGAVLLQENHPIAYFSKAFPCPTRYKSAYERELMAVVWAISKWKHYLMFNKFTIYTDQFSLRFLTDQKEVPIQYHRWVSKLLGYNFDIQYKAGKKNVVADALSRSHPATLGECNSIYLTHWLDKLKLNHEVKRDPKLGKIFHDIESGLDQFPNYTIQQGLLLYKGKIILPANSSLIPSILQEFHDSTVGGHGGFHRTLQRISQQVSWPGMRKAIKAYVNHCAVCQQHKYSTLSPAGLLQPLPIPNQIWEDITMDFIEGLPKSEGFDSIMVVVDRLSKYSHYIAVKHPFSAATIAEIFAKEIIRLHGLPNSIVSDRGSPFTSKFWKELHQLQGTKLKFSSSYHPETDGQSEVYPEEILKVHHTLYGAEILVKWANLPAHEASWEHVHRFRKSFPDFQLEDKLALEGEGIDKFYAKKYKRRNSRQLAGRPSQRKTDLDGDRGRSSSCEVTPRELREAASTADRREHY
ncbi:uncharacterized protein LOC144713125 [Wolffia australiana]